MLKFNNSDIFTGYLKQLLKSFNLPCYRVYTDDSSIIYSTLASTTGGAKVHAKYVPYIKDNKIQICDTSQQEKTVKEWTWLNTKYYTYGEDILNYTRTLISNTNTYDNFTHKYLGDYLRFQRDYNHLNLMSLYNCFSNELATNTEVEVKQDAKVITKFNSSDAKYKIYRVPVKFFNTYTIAIDSELPVEVCCGLYDAYQISTEKIQDLYNKTYKKYNRLYFSKPVLYDKLMNYDNTGIQALAAQEDSLCLFIKLPIKNKSSIVVLEGNYVAYANPILDIKTTEATIAGEKKTLIESTVTENHWITNFEAKHEEEAVKNFKPMSQLQLLALNTGISHPFADRLIEYLTYNCITEKDSYYIPDNVRRVQKIMEINKNAIQIDGAWEEKYRPILYDYLLENKKKFDTYYDILGYIDKDIENTYAAIHIVTEAESSNPKSKYYKIKAGTKVILDTLKYVDIYGEEV